MKKTIAIVLNTTWNIKNFRAGLVKTLIHHGHTVYAIAPKDSHVDNIKSLGCKFVPLKNLNRKGKNPLQDYGLIKELETIYTRFNIDIALLYTIKPNIYGSMAASRTNTYSIATVTGLGYTFSKKGVTNQLVKQLYKKAFKKTDKILFQNPDDLKEFYSLNLKTKSHLGIVNGSGVDTQKFYASEMPLPAPFKFLFVGRLLKDKGIFELIDAFKSINSINKNTELHILGSIDKENPAALSDTDLQDILETNQSIKFHGRKSDVRPYIENCNCVVLPSYREGLPRVMIEAMSMARPIITSDAPGCNQVVQHNYNGFKCTAKDTISLANCMNDIISLRFDELVEMGNRGREIVLQKYDEKIIINSYLNLIDNHSTTNQQAVLI